MCNDSQICVRVCSSCKSTVGGGGGGYSYRVSGQEQVQSHGRGSGHPPSSFDVVRSAKKLRLLLQRVSLLSTRIAFPLAVKYLPIRIGPQFNEKFADVINNSSHPYFLWDPRVATVSHTDAPARRCIAWQQQCARRKSYQRATASSSHQHTLNIFPLCQGTGSDLRGKSAKAQSTRYVSTKDHRLILISNNTTTRSLSCRINLN